MYIIGGLDDQTALLVWDQLSTGPFKLADASILAHAPYAFVFYGHIYPWLTGQPLIWTFASLFLSFCPFNTWILVTLLMNLVSSFLLFRRFKFGFLYSLVFTFSAYTWIHLGVHMELLQLWIFPVFILLLFKFADEPVFLNSVFLGLFIAASILVSNYYGFFVLLFFVLWLGVRVTMSFVSDKRLGLVLVKQACISMLIGVTVAGVCVIPYVRANFFSGDGVVYLAERGDRTYDDFFTFSSRPWYYVLPPVKNPWVGAASEKIVSKLAATGYFLADDYFAGEHSGSYFGVPLLLAFGAVIVYVVTKGSGQVKGSMLTFAGVVFMLFLFALPPFFTISGLTIWTPGFLLYKLFPMFRVTTRISIVMLLCILISLGYGIDFFYEGASKNWKRFLDVTMPIVLALTIFGMYLPVKIQVIKDTPPVYEYLDANTPLGTKFAVYPYSQTTEAFYWLFEHKRYLINLRGYIANDFNSKVFTEKLITLDGLEDLKKRGGSYLVVLKNADEEDIVFFEASLQLLLDKEFESAYLFKVL